MAAAEATEKLLQAACDGDVDAALAALAAGADPNGQSDNWMLVGGAPLRGNARRILPLRVLSWEARCRCLAF